ncbi:MAG TPA: NYN domain-containing protein [Patescibacteria group bacterium]|nr:NYN domain-containing protein [Patescibacteria group bacterium]
MRTIAFIDASNLFYGGEKSLGWKVDCHKLRLYLQKKYTVKTAYYFGGVEIGKFPFDYTYFGIVPIVPLLKYFDDCIEREPGNSYLLRQYMKKVRFYSKLEQFGYSLCLKPVKIYHQSDGTIKKKANCDVDMTFYFMKEKNYFDRAVILSGDGDFLLVLQYLQQLGKEVIILARGSRTARELRQFAGANFRDFVRLRNSIEWNEK